jgi:tetratricopeptide (TPR) repeat protein
MNRALYVAGISYVALCGVVLAKSRSAPSYAGSGEPSSRPIPYEGSAGAWFSQVKPFCNSVEVEVRQQQMPAPASAEGAGYSAACYALAGKIERARERIDKLDEGDRRLAANIVFNVGHPVADAGDDQSAGPIMRLVIQYTPENYMALYHAGMSEYILGELDFARIHLKSFLEIYKQEDGWRANAIEVLGRMSAAK